MSSAASPYKSKYEIQSNEECKRILERLQHDELLLATLIIAYQKLEYTPKSLPEKKSLLIEKCLEMLDELTISDRAYALIDIEKTIQTNALRDHDFQWIADPMPKRLEVFLRETTQSDWVQVDAISNTKRFKLMYSFIKIEEAHRLKLLYDKSADQTTPSLEWLKSKWQEIAYLNEFVFVEKEKEKEKGFLPYFHEKASKKLKERASHQLFKELSTQQLNTTEDALIFLDHISHDPEIRETIVSKIRKNWKQKQKRDSSTNKQKGFYLSEETSNALAHLAEKHSITQTEVISILITEELENNLYISCAPSK